MILNLLSCLKPLGDFVMNRLISFYLNEGPDKQGRTLAQIWAMSDDELMDTHDVVQWLFPLAEPSKFNPTSPVLTDKQIAAFHDNARLRENLLKSFCRFMQVFGLSYIDGEVRQAAHKDIWLSLNHNWLRFSRILKSLTILGLHDEAMAFFQFLEKKVGNAPSMSYWRAAVGLGANRV
jgi:Opioid growth factor receptor (OGFr) conserved region